MFHKLKILISICLVAGFPAFASDGPAPVQQHNSNAVWFENWVGLTNTSMSVAFPDGTVETVQAKSGTPVFQLKGANVQDGIYRYELRAATDKTETIKNPVDNGRGDAARSDRAIPFYLAGQFTVSRGVIVTPKDLKEE